MSRPLQALLGPIRKQPSGSYLNCISRSGTLTSSRLLHASGLRLRSRPALPRAAFTGRRLGRQTADQAISVFLYVTMLVLHLTTALSPIPGLLPHSPDRLVQVSGHPVRVATTSLQLLKEETSRSQTGLSQINIRPSTPIDTQHTLTRRAYPEALWAPTQMLTGRLSFQSTNRAPPPAEGTLRLLRPARRRGDAPRAGRPG